MSAVPTQDGIHTLKLHLLESSWPRVVCAPSVYAISCRAPRHLRIQPPSVSPCRAHPTLCVSFFEVRRWGILSRPIEVRLRRFNQVVDCVIRLHNFCRQRKISVPERNTKGTLPREVTFNEDGDLTGEYFEPEPVRTVCPTTDQAQLSQPREAIRTRGKIVGINRPIRNKDRNASQERL